MYKKPQNKIFQGGSEQVQVDLFHGGYLIMSWKKQRQLDHHFLGVGSKDIPEEVKGRGKKEQKCATGLQACKPFGGRGEAFRSDRGALPSPVQLGHLAHRAPCPWASVRPKGGGILPTSLLCCGV